MIKKISIILAMALVFFSAHPQVSDATSPQPILKSVMVFYDATYYDVLTTGQAEGAGGTGVQVGVFMMPGVVPGDVKKVKIRHQVFDSTWDQFILTTPACTEESDAFDAGIYYGIKLPFTPENQEYYEGVWQFTVYPVNSGAYTQDTTSFSVTQGFATPPKPTNVDIDDFGVEWDASIGVPTDGGGDATYRIGRLDKQAQSSPCGVLQTITVSSGGDYNQKYSRVYIDFDNLSWYDSVIRVENILPVGGKYKYFDTAGGSWQTGKISRSKFFVYVPDPNN